VRASLWPLNLNAFSPIYVVRDWHDRLIGQRELVARIDPVQRPTMSEEQAKIITTVRWLAKKAIKKEWLARKTKLSHVDPKDLSQAADAYLEAHRAELIEKAKDLAVQILKVMHKSESPNLQGLPLCICRAQKGSNNDDWICKGQH
jgi:hypothetical protein